MYDLKKLIEANTVEGVVDYEKVMASVDTEYVNPIVAKKTDKDKLSKEAVSTLVKELGIDGESIDDLKLYVKKMGGNTDEFKEANITLQKEFDVLKGNFDKEVESRTKLETEVKDKTQLDMIKSLGVTDETQIKFLKWDFNNNVTEEKDFNAVVAEYATEHKLKTTNKVVKDPFAYKPSDDDFDISD